MSVQISGLAPRATATDATSGHELEAAFGVHALTVGTHTFVYVAGLHDNGFSVFELGSNGSLTNVQNVQDNAALELDDVANFTSTTIGGVTYLYTNAERDDGISVFRVGANGSVTNVQNITDNAALELNGSEGRMTVATVGATQFLLATGDDDNGVSVFRINADGTLANTHNVTDTSLLELDNAMDVVTASIDGHTFVYVAGEDDNGLAVFELDANGRLRSTFNLSDDATLNLWGATGLTTATVGGATYLIASGCFDDGLSVFALTNTGTLTNVFNVSDNASLGLDGAQGLTTFTIDTETFLAVSGRDDDAITIFHVGTGGVLTDVTATFDDAGVALNQTQYNTVATVGGKPILIATGFLDNGVSTFEILVPGSTDPNQPPTDITVQGGTVQENAAAGTVVATLGAVDPNAGDTFTFSIGGDAAPFVIVGNEIRVASGAQIDYETQTSYAVTLTVTDSQNASYSEDFVIGVTDVNESTVNVIIGTTAADTLTGTSGVDDIWGRAGNDTLSGLDGDDTIHGEDGNDHLDGGLGADALIGGTGGDTYTVDSTGDTITELAGQGVDTVRTSLTSFSLDTAAHANIEHLNYSGPNAFTGWGNALANTLSGGTLDDTFYGGGGNDIFKAGAGGDTLTGDAGQDDFTYTALKDSLTTATGRDRIMDFVRGEDDIVLTTIDANSALAGNQAFVLDANGSFSAGEIRQTVTAEGLLIELNTNSTAAPEMAILLAGLTSPLAAADFEL